MPKTYFLVPGYGAQGATAKDIKHCFNPDGLGAIINASRSILYAYSTPPWKEKYNMTTWRNAAEEAVIAMNKELRDVDDCSNADKNQTTLIYANWYLD